MLKTVIKRRFITGSEFVDDFYWLPAPFHFFVNNEAHLVNPGLIGSLHNQDPPTPSLDNGIDVQCLI